MEQVTTLRLSIDSRDAVKAQKDLDNLAKSSTVTEKAASNLSRAIGAVGFAAMAVEAVKTADAMNRLDGRLRLATESTAEYTAQWKELAAVAERSRSGLSETITLFTKLNPAVKQLGGDTAATNAIVEAFSKSLKVGGASSAESASAILQFAQAMGSGVLRGEEFNAIFEASAKTMDYLAKGMGVPVTEMRKLAQEGELTSGKVAAAMLKMTESINKDFSTIPPTVGDALTQAKNELSIFILETDKALGITQALAGGITDSVAAVKSAVGVYHEYSSVINGAAVAAGVLLTAQKAAAVTEAALTAARARNTVTTTAYDAALVRTVTTTSMLTTAQSLSAAAAGAMGTALKAIPFLAVAGLVATLAASFFDAKSKSDDLNDSLNATAESLGKLSRAQLEYKRTNLSLELQAVGLELRQLQQEYGKTSGRTVEQQKEIDDLKATYNALLEASKNVATAQTALREGKKSTTSETKKENLSIEEQIKLLEKNAGGVKKVTAAKKELSDAQKEAAEFEKRSAEYALQIEIEKNQKRRKLLKEEADTALYWDKELASAKLANISAVTLARQEAEDKAAKAALHKWDGFFDDLDKAMENQLFDAMVGKWDSFGDWLKDFWSSLVTSIARAASSQLSDSLISGLRGGLSEGGMAQNLIKAISGGGLESAVAPSIESLGNFLQATSVNLGSSPVGLGAGLLGGVGGYAAGALGDKLFGADTKASTFGSIGGALGAAFGGPVGFAIGAGLGSVIGGMFGKKKVTGAGYSFADMATGESQDVTGYTDYKKKSWFRSKSWTDFSELSQSEKNKIDAIFDSYDYLLTQLGATEGIFLEAGKYSGQTFADQLAKNFIGIISTAGDDAAIYQAWKEYAGSVNTTMTEAFGSVVAQMVGGKRSFSEWALGKGSTGQLSYTAAYLQEDFDALAKSLNATGVNAANFQKMYDAAIAANFTPENIARWGALGDALVAATEAQKQYTAALAAQEEAYAKMLSDAATAQEQAGAAIIATVTAIERTFKSLRATTKSLVDSLSTGKGGTADIQYYLKQYHELKKSFMSAFDPATGLVYADSVAQMESAYSDLSGTISALSGAGITEAQRASLLKEVGVFDDLFGKNQKALQVEVISGSLSIDEMATLLKISDAQLASMGVANSYSQNQADELNFLSKLSDAQKDTLYAISTKQATDATLSRIDTWLEGLYNAQMEAAAKESAHVSRSTFEIGHILGTQEKIDIAKATNTVIDSPEFNAVIKDMQQYTFGEKATEFVKGGGGVWTTSDKYDWYTKYKPDGSGSRGMGLQKDLGGKAEMLREIEMDKLFGFATGGYTGDAPVNAMAGIVHGQEYVVNAKTTRDLGLNGQSGLFKQMAQELSAMRAELSEMRRYAVTQTATAVKSLNVNRAILGSMSQV